MPSLGFEKKDKGDTPVAIVKGGKYDKKILYLHDDSILASHAKGETKPKTKTKSRATIPAGGAGASDSDSSDSESEEGKKSKVIRLTDGQFELLPTCDPDKRQVWYIAGQSGSGKSYIAKTLADFYHKLFPERGVYLISKLDKDETLDALPFIKRVKIQSLIDDYPALEEFQDCLTIFDDWDTLKGDAYKTVHKLIEDLAIMGRHTNSNMLILSHYLSNFKDTRLIWMEATHAVVYPMSTSPVALRRVAETYIGIDDEDLKRQRKYGSRWLCYKKGFPMYCISQTSAELVNC